MGKKQVRKEKTQNKAGREGGMKEGHGKKLKRSQFGRKKQVVNLGC